MFRFGSLDRSDLDGWRLGWRVGRVRPMRADFNDASGRAHGGFVRAADGGFKTQVGKDSPGRREGRRMVMFEPGIGLAQEELGGREMDVFAIQGAAIMRERERQRSMAELIDAPRDSRGVLANLRHRAGGEYAVRRAAHARDLGSNIFERFFVRERSQRGRNGDSLTKTGKIRVVEVFREPHLPAKHDLNGLIRSALEVGEKANLLELSRTEVLRLVNKEDGLAAMAEPLGQVVNKPESKLLFAATFKWER